MELFEAIDSRSSAGRLSEPKPSSPDLERILQAAGRAPDHGRLTPWRLIPIAGTVRETFAAAAADAKRERLAAMTPEQWELERDKILRSPCLVVVGCVVKKDFPKVPEVEQLVAVGAAVQNMFLAAHALGYGVMWKTGAAAYSARVKAAVGLRPEDHIIAILHIGTRIK
jgi:nitroreductase